MAARVIKSRCRGLEANHLIGGLARGVVDLSRRAQKLLYDVAE